MPDCRYVEIDGAGHSIGLDNPLAFDAAVRDEFLLTTRRLGANRDKGDIVRRMREEA
jgi:hypothetical protein